MKADRVPNPFGTRLRDWRRLHGLSQLGLALQAGTTPRHLSFLESGRSRPGSGIVLRLADALRFPHDAQLRALHDMALAATSGTVSARTASTPSAWSRSSAPHGTPPSKSSASSCSTQPTTMASASFASWRTQAMTQIRVAWSSNHQ